MRHERGAEPDGHIENLPNTRGPCNHFRPGLKNGDPFQHNKFFALWGSKSSWQIDAMKAQRKKQVFVILLLAQWPCRSGNGVCLNSSETVT